MKKWHKISQALVAVVLMIAMVGPAAAPSPARLHPLVAQLAAKAPEQIIAVIVRKAESSDQAERLAAQLGATITKDLRLIHAFAAEMPAGTARQLAAHPAVRWVSLDAPVVQASEPCAQCMDTSQLLNAYIRAIGADRLWNEPPYLQGQGITVAVVDSGITSHLDLKTNRLVGSANFNSNSISPTDSYGHGTHIAGTIGGTGAQSGGAYIGVAPKVNLLNVKVSDDQGAASTSDVVAGLQWVYDHKTQYNIRVVNLSLNSSVPELYHVSELDAAVEILWFNGIVVVVSAGNNGDNLDKVIQYAPANDPFVITVGATDDRGTADTGDDRLAPFSAYGLTESGAAKPDLVAPGTNIVSLLASHNAVLFQAHQDHLVETDYFRMSGTSMASAVVAGAAALLLQDEPTLTPDQVKYRLMATARPFGLVGTGAGYLDAYAAVHGTTKARANTLYVRSLLILGTPLTPLTWNSVNWNSVNWNSVNWNSDYWGN